MNIYDAIHSLLTKKHPDKKALIYCLNSSGPEQEVLFNKADTLTQLYYNNVIFIRGIIEFSNYCRGLCKYCGINANNKDITRYRMSPDEIIKNAVEANGAGYKTIVLQSGEDLYYTKDMIGRICEQIKRKTNNFAITLSIGERDFEEYEHFKSMGADRFLIKHEIANQKIYDSLHPHSCFENRVACQKFIKKTGYELGSGFMVGIPGQTVEILADDIIHFYKIKADMAGIGPFIPHNKTPFANDAMGSSLMTLKCVAAARLLIKNINLPATTALSVLDRQNFLKSFFCGANVVMKKVEPLKYRLLYDIYPKKSDAPLSLLEERKNLEKTLTSLGKQFI